MADFPENIISATPEKFRFTLIGETKTVICDTEPIEWQSGAIEFKRDLESAGVFVSFVCDSLTFVGNGAAMLKEIYEAYELTPKAKCTLIIEYWKEFDFVTPANGRRYIEFPSRFDINFNFYEKVKVDNFVFGIRVKAVNSSVQTKFDSRQDIDVDVTKLVSIGGFNISGYGANDIDLKKGLHFAPTDVQYNATLIGLGSRQPLNRLDPGDTYSSVPFFIRSNDPLGLPEVTPVNFITQKTINQLDQIPSFFTAAQYTKDLTVTYGVGINVTNRHVGSYPWELELLETKDTNPTGTKVITEIINTYSLGGVGGTKMVYWRSGTEIITVTEGNSLKLVVRRLNIEACAASFYIEGFNYLRINQTIVQTVATDTESFPLYEAIERTCQHILDVQYPIYSDFFGREDVVFRADGTKYSTENQLRFAQIQSGLNQRGLRLSDIDCTLALSFKKLFQTLKTIWNVGYTFEINPTLFGDSNPRIRIEEYSYFFQNTLALDLSARITKYDIKSKAMPELVPVDLKCGFDSYEYLSVNGRAEPNTTNQRTSPMNTATKIELISPIRGDTKGMLDNIADPIVESSEDTSGDSGIFIVKSRRNLTYDWIPETNENITVEDNTSLFKDSLLNRYFTPSRMLIRNGNRLKAGMTKLLSTDVLRFQKSDKTSTLKTSGLAISGADEYVITENQDIPLSMLDTPIFKADQHTVDVDFDFADLAAIQANPLGYLKFSDTITVYLLSLKVKIGEGKAEITGIERNAI